MGKKGNKTVIVWERVHYDLVATGDCYLFSFRDKPELSTDPILLQDGSLMYPGDAITESRGRHTAAGFHHIIMDRGYAIRYTGSYNSGEQNEAGSKMLCFEQLKDGDLLPLTSPSMGHTFIGYLETFEHSWLFCTPAIASRIVETSIVKRNV